MHVLLSVAGSGVLIVTGFKTPDPWQAFFGRKLYNVDQYDVFSQLIEGGSRLAALRFGGDGEDESMTRGGKKPVIHVNIVAQQLQAVMLDKDGKGTITLPIPAFNG